MKDNFDMKNLWAKQTISPQVTEEVLSNLNGLKRKQWRKLILINVLLIGSCVFIGFIWFKYQPQFLSTKIGIILSILAMIVYVYVYNRLIPSLKQMNLTQTNAVYLEQLKALKTQQHFLQNQAMAAYFILLGSGICLYMYEPAQNMTPFWVVFAYGTTLSWMAFNWFYLRPKSIKKEQAKLDDLMLKLEKMTQQLEEN
jgi:hypothetical protein